MSMIESAAAPAKCPSRNLVSNVVLGESNERYLEARLMSSRLET
jgi:hypothetical protein